METAALLVTALLFGGTVLYWFGFAGFVFSVLPAKQAGTLIRRAFPHFYLFVIIFSAIAAALLSTIGVIANGILAAIAVTTIPTRQLPMPAINNATDIGKRKHHNHSGFEASEECIHKD